MTATSPKPGRASVKVISKALDEELHLRNEILSSPERIRVV
jgi:hypothetical protein